MNSAIANLLTVTMHLYLEILNLEFIMPVLNSTSHLFCHLNAPQINIIMNPLTWVR